MAPVNKTDTENSLQTIYETNPLMATKKAEIAELQLKSDKAKSIWLKAREHLAKLTTRRNDVMADCQWWNNRGQQVDLSVLNNSEIALQKAKDACWHADIEDGNARTNLFIALT